MFYLGQNTDYGPGDSISDSSEEPLQRGRGKVSVMYDFREEGPVHQAHVVAEAGCWSRGADVTAHDFTAFLDTRRCKHWAPKIFS